MQNRKLKIFISMPFSGKQFEALYQERLDLKVLVESYGFELTEQFVGYQFKEDFESKDYDPKWVVGKETIKDSLESAGFSNINIAPANVSDFAKASCGGDFWKEYEASPDQVVIEAKV
jgi:hypothetical protein